MKIAFVHQPWDDALPAKREGSLAVWTHEVATRLAPEHDIAIFGRAAPSGESVVERDGITHYGVELRGDRKWLRLLRMLPKRSDRRPAFASRLFHCVYADRVGRRLAELSPDVVHVHNFSNFVPILRKRCPSAHYVLHMHCEWLSRLDPRMIEPRLRRCDAVVGCSEFITREVRNAFPALAERCHSVPNGVDPGRFVSHASDADAAQGDRILFVGRVSPEKGIHVLLDAFAEVHARRPECELAIVGPLAVAPREFIAGVASDEVMRSLAPHYEGDYIATLKARVESEFDGKAALLGQCDHTTIARHYANATVVVNPSLSESFGMSLVEAMASGRPVVASAVGGMPEVLNGQRAGLLAPPNDPHALADALCALLGDADRRAAMGHAGRERAAECYSWERVVETLLDVYGRVVHYTKRDSV